jgi:integrase
LKVVLKHAVAMGLNVDLQATDKARVLLGKSRQKSEHIAALPWKNVPEFYATLVDGSICHLALRLLILTAARSAEVRLARFDEIEGNTWVIPAGRTKGGQEHRIPLSREALATIDQAKPLSRKGFLFPSVRKGVISDATIRDDVADDGATRNAGTPARVPLLIPRLVRRGHRYAPRSHRGRASAQ